LEKEKIRKNDRALAASAALKHNSSDPEPAFDFTSMFFSVIFFLRPLIMP
jgi:hypothetical protein